MQVLIGFLSNIHFKSFVAVLTLLIMVLLIIVFIWRTLKKDLLKILGILAVIGLAMAADNDLTYFLTIIVLATLVTNLDFLQNITAILSKNETYFKHNLQKQGPSEIEKGIQEEQQEIEDIAQNEIENRISKDHLDENQSDETYKQDNNDVTLVLDKKNLTPLQFGLLAEEYTLRFLEKQYNREIERYVKLKTNGHRVIEFDGAMTDKDKTSFIEIKAIRSKAAIKGIIKSTYERSIENIINLDINLINNGNRVEFIFVFISVEPEEFKKILHKFLEGNKELNMIVKFEVYSFEDIGLEKVLL